jgi:hypothetical protein
MDTRSGEISLGTANAMANEEEEGTFESLDKRDGQSLKDTSSGRANVNFGLFSPQGLSALVTSDDGDPLVWKAAVDQLGCERFSGPSHFVDRGGDASQVDTIEVSEYERPYGPGHVEDGG